MATQSSLDQALRAMIRTELANELEPMRDAIAQLQSASSQLDMLSQLAERLAPLLGVAPGTFSRTAPRRRGRPPKSALAAGGRRKAGGGRRGPKPVNNRPCAIKGCGRPARTKGYCAAHYQKLRMLERTKRLPSDWKDFADPNSVNDLVLPRGRAASKALKAAKSE